MKYPKSLFGLILLALFSLPALAQTPLPYLLGKQNDSVRLTYKSEAGWIYRLLQSDDLQRYEVTTFQIGDGTTQSFTVATDQTDTAFFRILVAPPNSAIDSDADGISDAIELGDPNLDPLDPNDGAADPDGDGRSTSIEIQDGTDPQSANPAVLLGVENLPGTSQFEPLRNSVVPTLKPTIRIAGTLPNVIRVFVDRDDNRAGIRGGPGGLGKEVTASFARIAPNAWEGTITVPDGLNRIVVTEDPARGAMAAARMLNYGDSYEDTNGNDRLDAGEDDNLNGALDPGEDRNNNGELDATEDFNGNGLLDPGEDLNGNGFLDGFEDLNGNLQLDHGEDLNNDKALNPGEDINLNGTLDLNITPGIAPLFSAGQDYIQDSRGLAHQARTLLLTFQPNATPVHISRFLQRSLGNQRFSLRPLGIEFHDSGAIGETIVVTVFIEQGETGAVYEELNGAPNRGFPPPVQPAFPLSSAIPNLKVALASPIAEVMPRRLRFGSDINAGQGYSLTTGGFDHSGDTPDELNAAWPHFYMQSYLAQALIENIVPANADGRIFVIDRLFGGGTGILPDLLKGRFRLCHNLDSSTGKTGSFPDLSGLRERNPTKAHGVHAVLYAAGSGDAFVLGTARRARIRALNFSGEMASWLRALKIAAFDPNVSVINMSLQFQIGDLKTRTELVRAHRIGLAGGIAAAQKANKILVLAAGNRNQDLTQSLATAFGAPHHLNRPIDDDGDGAVDEDSLPGDDISENPLVVVVGATGAQRRANTLLKRGGGINGREYLFSESNFGDRVTVTAPGDGLARTVVIDNNAWDKSPIAGTSFAAPYVSGILADLDLLATQQGLAVFNGLNNRRRRVVRLMSSTADDLGTTVTKSAVKVRPSDDPGNGRDKYFGHGRVNYWKAALSVLNGGLSAQEGRPAPNGVDPRFQELPVLDDKDTQWYGFEIITNRPRASIWIDGIQLEDQNARTPIGTKIKAYKGVSSAFPSLLGIPLEDPMAGIVPIGSSNSEYRAAFSIPRSELLTPDGKPRMLELRLAASPPTDKPFFSLRLELDKMRNGRVPGVSFDDFVFEITPTDFGDAPTYYASQSTPRRIPVVDLPADGGRTLNSNMEWFGPPTSRVTPEPDARQNLGFPDISADADGVPNTSSEAGKANRDGADDGFRIPRFFEGAKGAIRFQVSLAPKNNGFRYGLRNDDDRNLYVNGWIDWNRDAVWADSGIEVPLKGVKLREPGIIWGLEAGAPIVRIGPGGSQSAEFEFQVTPPLTPLSGEASSEPVWARFRLDYGENAGRRTSSLFDSIPGLGLSGPLGGATRYGEVEDYPIVVVKAIFIPLIDGLLDPKDRERRQSGALELGGHGLRAKSTVTDLLRSLTIPEDQDAEEQSIKAEALRAVTFNGGFLGSATLLSEDLTEVPARGYAHIGVRDNLLRIALDQPSEAPFSLTLRGPSEVAAEPGPLLLDLGVLLEDPSQVVELSAEVQEIITSGEVTLRLETEDLGSFTGNIGPEPSDLAVTMKTSDEIRPGTETTVMITPIGGTAPWNVGILAPWGATAHMEIEGPTEVVIGIPEEAAEFEHADLSAIATDFSGLVATSSVKIPLSR